MVLAKGPERPSGGPVSTDGYTLVCEFKRRSVPWKVYEDLRTRDGSMVFVSSTGETRNSRKVPKRPWRRALRTLDSH
jgi:hypothetical protein